MKKNADRERGEGSVCLRGRTYWIRYWRRGKEFRESSHSTNETDAVKLLDRRLKEIWADRHGLQAFAPKAEKIYVDELINELEKAYKLDAGRGLPQFKSHLKPIKEAFGDMRAVDVTAKRVDDYIDRRLHQDKKAPTTINRETQLLGQAFKLAFQRGQLVTVPHIRRLPERNVRQGFFDRADFEAIIAALPEYLQDFAQFGYLSGWRKGEIASLTWADVDRGAGIIHLRAEHAKNGYARKLALEGDPAAIIERCFVSREYKTPSGPGISLYVFHRKGEPVGDIRKAWASACKTAGVPGKLFHDLRRTAVRNMVRAGVREGVIGDN